MKTFEVTLIFDSDKSFDFLMNPKNLCYRILAMGYQMLRGSNPIPFVIKEVK